MPKASPPDFKIHVDPSCLTNPNNSEMSPERTASNQTIIHHELEYDSTDGRPAKEKSDKQLVEDQGTQDRSRAEEARERQLDRIEAQIQAAARAVVASIEEDNYHGEDSVVSMQTDESYDLEHSQLTYNDGTELTYEDGTELTYDGTEGSYETEDEHHEREGEGDSSSQHDGDIDDDVFTNSDHSKRSSLNSVLETNSCDETPGKELTSPAVGEEATSQPVSRIPSTSSYAVPDPMTVTPSRVLARPPFRTPSSVRAMQMTSPTPSLYSSPRSTKRHLPTVSRIGTPSSPFSKKTPTRFKTKKENPLVLLHVTVLPLSWNYSHAMSAPDPPPALQAVKDNWRLLQGHLGEAVLERGILLPHPQDDYEVLEERLLEALELPVRPRAKILKCGHYMGPETPSSDDEGRDHFFQVEERKWCDICGKDVKLEGSLDGYMEKRFRVKIYASNGLMRAGAWAACWREMERVDVELQPFVEGALAVELERFAAGVPVVPATRYEAEDGFIDEDEATELVIEVDDTEEINKMKHEEDMIQKRIIEEEKLMQRKMADEERMREIYGTNTPPAEEHRQHKRQKGPTEDSLPELILAAFKVAMRDTKNVAIVILSILVLLLALKPKSVIIADPSTVLATGHLNDVMINIEPVGTPRSIEETPIRVPQPVAKAKSMNPPEIVQEQLPAIDYVERVEDIAAPEARVKTARQVTKSADRAVPAIGQAGVREAAPSDQVANPDVVRKTAIPIQDLPSNNIQMPTTLEIDAAKLLADHNDPDLKEVVPVA